jgi:predicted metal-dependent enzyme (double-stranded beta helix superfamily)
VPASGLEDLELLLPYAHPSVAYATALSGVLAPRSQWSPKDLERVTRRFTRHAGRELHRVARFDRANRWYLRLALTEDVEVRLVTWTPGEISRPHDHRGVAGAYTVLYGELQETWRDRSGAARSARRRAGSGAAFGADREHTMTNRGVVGAISVHAYAPPLRPLAVERRVEVPAR